MKRASMFVLVFCLALPLMAGEKRGPVVLERVKEPNENAFTFLKPKGWLVEGGIFRVNPMAAGPGNAVAAKLDISLRRDEAGTVLMRWLPDILFIDMRGTPMANMGMLPAEGANMNGAYHYVKRPAAQFLVQMAFPYAHPQATDLQVIDARRLEKLAAGYQKRVRALPFGISFTYDAAVVTVEYSEGGRRYREKLFGVVEDWGAIGAGLWSNKETMAVRAPVEEFDYWEKLFFVIHGGTRVNTKWLAGELRGQIERGEVVLETQRKVQEIDRQITAHRQKTNAEIQEGMYLTLTGQEDTINPFDKRVERGSGLLGTRWQNRDGDVIYSPDASYNPNNDRELRRKGFKKAKVKR